MKNVFCFIMAALLNVNSFSPNITLPPFADMLKCMNKQASSLSSVRVWGWSRNGKLAYSVDKFIEGRGGIITTAVILNFVDNRIIWEQSIDSLNLTDKNAAYAKFYQNYRDVCVRNGIEFVQVEYEYYFIGCHLSFSHPS
jgi:hypothetical protein